MTTEHDLWPAAHKVDRRKQRSRQRKLGPSAIGTCRRRAGYIRFGEPPAVDDNKRAAILGTWLHKGLLDTLRREYGAVIEITVEDDKLKGHVDAYYPTAEVVEDAKTKSIYVIDKVTERGPSVEDLFQIHLYGDLLRTGKYRFKKGLPGAAFSSAAPPLPVARVRLRYLCRDNGKEWVWEQPFSESILEEARAWLTQVLAAKTVDDLPRDHDGPGLSVICDNCPSRKPCWPSRPDGSAVQAVLIRDDADIARTLVEYDAARSMASEGDAAKRLARAKLDGSPAGQYGDLVLSWTGGREKPSEEVVDVDAMLEMYRKAGLAVPHKTVGGGFTSRTIGVRPPPKTG